MIDKEKEMTFLTQEELFQQLEKENINIGDSPKNKYANLFYWTGRGIIPKPIQNPDNKKQLLYPHWIVNLIKYIRDKQNEKKTIKQINRQIKKDYWADVVWGKILGKNPDIVTLGVVSFELSLHQSIAYAILLTNDGEAGFIKVINFTYDFNQDPKDVSHRIFSKRSYEKFMGKLAVSCLWNDNDIHIPTLSDVFNIIPTRACDS